MKSSTLIVAVGCAVAFAGTALAQGHGSILQQRQALMQQQGHALGAIHAYLEGTAPKAKAEAAAAELTNTTRKIPDLFPEGSGGTSPDGKFATSPKIWTSWQGFLAAQNNAVQKAFALNRAVRTGNRQRITAAFADLGKNGCGGCHEKFREKK